jgi:hypothetical protein
VVRVGRWSVRTAHDRPRACPWPVFQPALTAAVLRGPDGPCRWNSSPLFLVILVSGAFGRGCSLGGGKAFEPRWSAGDRQLRSFTVGFKTLRSGGVS